MELLERDGALAVLADARGAAAAGDGRVVFVTGEPGIGKTALVTRFLRDLDSDARMLCGTCDDLSTPVHSVRFETSSAASRPRSRRRCPLAPSRITSRRC